MKKQKYSTAELRRRFVDGLASGKTQYQAYIDAGYAVKGKKDSYIYSRASELAAQPAIQAALAQAEEDIREKRSQALAWTRDKAAERALYMLNHLLQEARETGDYSAYSKEIRGWMDFLSRLDGIYAADRDKHALSLAELERQSTGDKDTRQAIIWVED